MLYWGPKGHINQSTDGWSWLACYIEASLQINTRLSIIASILWENFTGAHSFFSFTCNRFLLFCSAMAAISNLITFSFNNCADESPDNPKNEGNDDLNNRHDKPQDAHHQVENHLQEKSGIKIPTTEASSSLYFRRMINTCIARDRRTRAVLPCGVCPLSLARRVFVAEIRF